MTESGACGVVPLLYQHLPGKGDEIPTFSNEQMTNKQLFFFFLNLNRQVAAWKFFRFSHCKINTHQQFEIKGKIRPQFYTCPIVFQSFLLSQINLP